MAKIKVWLSAIFTLFVIVSAFGQCDCVIDTAQNEIGVTEATGNNDGEDVEKYLASTGLDAGYAWCAAFVNWCHKQCDYEGPDKAAWSPSWFPSNKTIYKRSEGKRPQSGDVFGIYFRSKERIAHVGLIDRWREKYAITVEGNTNEAGSREGDGVMRKRRLKRQIYKAARWHEEQ